MELFSANPHRAAPRPVRCMRCHQVMSLADVIRGTGMCRLCTMEVAEGNWRTVYDRDNRIGEIPANLKAAYKL